jgi:hypothetical protein
MSWQALRRGAVSLVVAAGAVPAVHACGYHDPSSVNLGMLNWSYPDALHVRTAVWMAQRDGAIARTEPLDPDDPLPARMRQTLRLRETVAALTAVRDRIAGALDGRPTPAFSIVLIGPLLWTRFVPAAGTLQVEVHSAGPAGGDVVIVTDEPVVGALLDVRLTPREARESGLVRFYGAPADIAPVAALLDLLTIAQSARAAGVERGPAPRTP